MNSIGKIALNFTGENEIFFRSLYSNWDSFFTKNIEKSADEVLMLHDDPSLTLELDTLELDLGSIPEADFEQQFAVVFKEKLEELLLEYLYETGDRKVKRVHKQKRLSELLCHFLLYGSLPWSVESKYKDINVLFFEVVRTAGAELKQFLSTYGHYTSLQQRLVFQLGDKALEEGIRLIAPGESNFITSYVYFLQAKYKVIERPVIRESSHRNVVWEVVYAYLLNNQSSFFNKKSFLKYTIRNLAARHNISYEHLLRIITYELENQAVNASAASELFIMLSQLKREVPKQDLEGSVTDIARLYRILIADATKSQQQQSKSNRNILTAILKQEDSCRRFLQLLDENEIIKLVKIVVPNEHVFVVSYAKSLDKQKEQGILQGKAGGEFRLVKWQIIFPILLENNGYGFNRKYFVLRTLKRVAAHYNLEVHEILAYFLNNEPETFRLDEKLKLIFIELYSKTTAAAREKQTPAGKPDFRAIIYNIRAKKELTIAEIGHWKILLKSVSFREKVLEGLKEDDHRVLINILFPEQSPIITAYAKSLDIYQKRAILEGKTGGRFTQLKWKFIHAVLFEPQHQVFNKKYFVSRVLSRIAAHYNLKTEELLVFFYKEIIEPGTFFPSELVKVLKELYTEQVKITEKKEVKREDDIQKESHTAEEKARKRLIQHFGSDTELTFLITALAKEHEFVEYIERVLEAEFILRRFLIAEFKLIPDKKKLLEILLYLSGGYSSLSLADIMGKVILLWLKTIKEEEKRERFEKELQYLAKTNMLIKETLTGTAEFAEPQNEQAIKKDEIMKEQERESVFINNAGLVLFSPYFPRLFSMLSLTTDGKFNNTDAQIRAMFLMQYAAGAEGEFAEHELGLNKLLTGFKAGTAIPLSVELTEEEKSAVNGMLKGVLGNWDKLRNTSVEALQESFILREGKLEEFEDIYMLTIAEKTLDILIDSLPWNFRTIKYSWMEKGINVKWR